MVNGPDLTYLISFNVVLRACKICPLYIAACHVALQMYRTPSLSPTYGQTPFNPLPPVRPSPGISIDELPVQSAFAGDHVTVTLSGVEPQSQTVGVVLCDPAQPVRVTTRVQARIVIFSIDLPITKGYQVRRGGRNAWVWDGERYRPSQR